MGKESFLSKSIILNVFVYCAFSIQKNKNYFLFRSECSFASWSAIRSILSVSSFSSFSNNNSLQIHSSHLSKCLVAMVLLVGVGVSRFVRRDAISLSLTLQSIQAEDWMFSKIFWCFVKFNFSFSNSICNLFKSFVNCSFCRR